MKTLLLILGVVCLIACVLSLLYAVLNRQGYYNLLDGEGEVYKRLHKRMVVSFVVGIALAAIGIACLFLRSGI